MAPGGVSPHWRSRRALEPIRAERPLNGSWRSLSALAESSRTPAVGTAQSAGRCNFATIKRALSEIGRLRSCRPWFPSNTSTNLRQRLFCEGTRGQERKMASGATQNLDVGLKPTRSKDKGNHLRLDVADFHAFQALSEGP